MWKKDRQKKGFTLVEVLVVIGIIAIMSVLAVGGYTSYRQTALLDLSVDDLISQMNEAREKTVKGIDLEVDQASRCYGLYFVKTGEGFEVKRFWQDYVGKKIWVNEGWEYRGCGNFDGGNAAIITMDQAISVESIEIGGSEVGNSFVMRFVPPDGKVEIGDEVSLLAESKEKIKVVVRYGEGDKSRTQSFVYDPESLTSSDE